MEHERSVYRLIDLMGDVGGFLGILQILGQVILYFISSGDITPFLISKLFEKRTNVAPSQPSDNAADQKSSTMRAQEEL